MSATVQMFENIFDTLAPFETAESYDNVGVLVGRRDQEVTKILVSLDATMEVVEEAIRLGAELIVSHHPLFFHARKNMVEEDPEARIVCKMIRNNLSLISAHTNLDQTNLSGSAACAKLLNLQNIRKEGFIFAGDLQTSMTADALRENISAVLPMNARLYGNTEKKIQTLAICGGAYDEGWEQAKRMGADALLTGEVRHHNALNAAMSDFVLLDGGHYGTEAPLVPYLGEYLQNHPDVVKYKIRVFMSHCAPFGRV